MPDQEQLSNLVDEATARFVGKGEIVGVAIGGDSDLTIFFAHANAAQEEAVRNWAKHYNISVAFVESGRFTTRFLC